MSPREIRIATRKSALALWQAEYVKARLEAAHPGLNVTLVPMVSRGDKLLDSPLSKIGGKGLFVKELETALLDNEADIAVHSMKDVPMDFPEGLGLFCICEREDPRDAFVSNTFSSLDALPAGSVVGTSSLRRQAQLLTRRPDLQIRFLRGNVNTRLAKLDAGEYDAIILAAAGLIRLGFEDRITSAISVDDSLPAGGQGRWASNAAAPIVTFTPCWHRCTTKTRPLGFSPSEPSTNTSMAVAKCPSPVTPCWKANRSGCVAWWVIRTVAG